ncbi:MAG TPA: adenine phosphoribosyltransferase [Candidatus Omnitrophota bacterium]|nr:adenine phosphoribosyltransferase [Candidatus Omnitrophota bacterium]HPD83848.1 adenine phosphoribosyltransferase [Candidatus Omnitrophota bacterium]HRZ02705.1 adenine phosphoribosyltransferase [Candidatus Omnitrophota bacterium]
MKKTELQKQIRDIPDFPKPGIIFKDITPLLDDKEAFKKAIDLLAKKFKKEQIDHIVAVEARGFILGGALAYKMKTGFVPVRKKGKLPYKTARVEYQLEYGTDTLEMHEDAVKPGSRVLVVDDVLATGGTVKAVTDLLKRQQAQIVGIVFLIELKFLKGKEKLKDFPVYSVIKY